MNCPESLGFNLDTPQCLKGGTSIPSLPGGEVAGAAAQIHHGFPVPGGSDCLRS